MNFATVLISGAGQLGSRYLQGLSKCRDLLHIYVQDVSLESLLQAQQRWNEIGGPLTQHEVVFSTDMKHCSKQVDLAIVATTAHNRPEVVKEIALNFDVRYWLLEKVLAQSPQGLGEIQLHVGSKSLAWVNHPRRISLWHQKIHEQLNVQAPLHMSLAGGPWGVACNTVHYLDLLAWLSGEMLVGVCTDQLDGNWFTAKRVGNWEICGAITATFSGGSTINLQSTRYGSPMLAAYTIRTGFSSWFIDEESGVALGSDGSEIIGRLPLQSEVTGSLVETILHTGSCQLPMLGTATAMHTVFINAMLSHWRQHCDPAATFIPIT